MTLTLSASYLSACQPYSEFPRKTVKKIAGNLIDRVGRYDYGFRRRQHDERGDVRKITRLMPCRKATGCGCDGKPLSFEEGLGPGHMQGRGGEHDGSRPQEAFGF